MPPKAKPPKAKNSELIRLYEDISNLKSKLTSTAVQIKEERQV